MKNWAIVLLLPLACLAVLHNFLTIDIKMGLFLGVTIFVILVWAFEVLPSVQAAILLPLVYVIADIAPAAKVFSPWLSFLPWVCVGGLIFGDILGRTGLAKRIALSCVKAMGGTFTSLVFGLMAGGIILAFLVPAIMARVVIFYAITMGFAEALELPKNSRMSSAILLAGFCAATSPTLICMTASEVTLLGINVINAKTIIVDWQGFLLHNFPVALVYCLISATLLHLVKGKERLPDKAVVAQMVDARLGEMGRISADEIKTLILLVFGVAMFVVLGPQRGPWMFLFCACLAFFPGLNLIHEKQLRTLNFGFIFFITGCMAIGAAAEHLGLPKMIGKQMASLLEGHSPLTSILLSYGAGLGLNFLLTPLAATGSMSAPLVEVAQALGMNPAPLIYTFVYGLEQYIFPYEYALLLFFFMDGRVTLGHIIPALGIRMVTTLVLIAVVAYPYWKMLGIL